MLSPLSCPKIWGQLLKSAEMYEILLLCLHGGRFHRQKILKQRKLLCHSLLITSDEQPDTSAVSPGLTKSVVGTNIRRWRGNKESNNLFVLLWSYEFQLQYLTCWGCSDVSNDTIGDSCVRFNPWALHSEPWYLTGVAVCGIQYFCENSLEDVTFSCSTESPVRCICRQLIRMHI